MTTRGFTAQGSSTIETAEYDAERSTLTVTFRDGSSYEYSGVPQNTFDAFEAARSKGSFHANSIRDNFRHRKL